MFFSFFDLKRSLKSSRVPDDRAHDKDVPECSYHRHNPIKDEEAGLDLRHKDEGLLRVARIKCAVLHAGVVHLGLTGVTS